MVDIITMRYKAQGFGRTDFYDRLLISCAFRLRLFYNT